MNNRSEENIQINGSVAPGFESVKALYEKNMQTLEEMNTQLCIYHQGKKVVDLWATAIDDKAFSADSIANIFSSGKSLETIAIASLVGKGLIRYDAKITEYWPEFGANNKETLTVAELMRHEAGLAAFNVSIDPDDLLTENIKQNKIGSIIEAHPQKFRPNGGSTREYHAVTRGWIVNEVFRRVDPTGRTIGEFFREDISGPLDIDIIIGVKQDELSRVSKVSPVSPGFIFRQSLKPKFLGRRMELNIFQIIAKLARLLPKMRNGTTGGAPPPFLGMDRIAFINDPSVVMGETPSANANGSARGLAKLAAVMSLGGSWDGTEYLNKTAWAALHGEPLERDMGFSNTTFTQGGLAQFPKVAPAGAAAQGFNAGREGYFGWMGLGGSIFQWHPDHQIGFGYVPTSLNVLDLFNERGKSYQAEAVQCVAKLG